MNPKTMVAYLQANKSDIIKKTAIVLAAGAGMTLVLALEAQKDHELLDELTDGSEDTDLDPGTEDDISETD